MNTAMGIPWFRTNRYRMYLTIIPVEYQIPFDKPRFGRQLDGVTHTTYFVKYYAIATQDMCNKNMMRQLHNIPIGHLSEHRAIALLGLDFIFYHNGGMTLTKQVTILFQNQNTFYNQSGEQKRGGKNPHIIPHFKQR